MIINNYLVRSEDHYDIVFRELDFKFNKRMIILMRGELGSGKTTFYKTASNISMIFIILVTQHLVSLIPIIFRIN